MDDAAPGQAPEILAVGTSTAGSSARPAAGPTARPSSSRASSSTNGRSAPPAGSSHRASGCSSRTTVGAHMSCGPRATSWPRSPRWRTCPSASSRFRIRAASAQATPRTASAAPLLSASGSGGSCSSILRHRSRKPPWKHGRVTWDRCRTPRSTCRGSASPTGRRQPPRERSPAPPPERIASVRCGWPRRDQTEGWTASSTSPVTSPTTRRTRHKRRHQPHPPPRVEDRDWGGGLPGRRCEMEVRERPAVGALHRAEHR